MAKTKPKKSKLPLKTVLKKRKGKKLGRNFKITQKNFLIALKDTAGLYSLVGEKLSCTRVTIHRFLKRYPDMVEAVDSERELMLDVAQNNLFTQVKAGNFKAIKFFLSTKGKSIGYTTRVEVEQKGGFVTMACVGFSPEEWDKKEKEDEKKKE